MSACSMFVGAWLNFTSLPSFLGVVSVDGLRVSWVDMVIAYRGWREKVCEKSSGDNSCTLRVGARHYRPKHVVF